MVGREKLPFAVLRRGGSLRGGKLPCEKISAIVPSFVGANISMYTEDREARVKHGIAPDLVMRHSFAPKSTGHSVR